MKKEEKTITNVFIAGSTEKILSYDKAQNKKRVCDLLFCVKDKDKLICFKTDIEVMTGWNTPEVNRIIELRESLGGWDSALSEMRRELRKANRGIVPEEDIINASQSNDIDRLSILLSERGLRYISKEKTEQLLERLHSRGRDISYLIDSISRRPNRNYIGIGL